MQVPQRKELPPRLRSGFFERPRPRLADFGRDFAGFGLCDSFRCPRIFLLTDGRRFAPPLFFLDARLTKRVLLERLRVVSGRRVDALLVAARLVF